MMRDYRLGPDRFEHRPNRSSVLPEVILELLVREIQEGLDPPAGIVVVDVDREEPAYLRPVEDAAPRVWGLLFAQLVDSVPVHHPELVHEVVGERLRLLTQEVHFVAVAHEGAAEVLDVDVAAGVREHVPVRHNQLHVTAPDSHTSPDLGRHSRTAGQGTDNGYELAPSARA